MRTIDHFMSFAVSLLPVVQFEHVKTLFESTQSQESKSEIDLHRSMRQCTMTHFMAQSVFLVFWIQSRQFLSPFPSLPFPFRLDLVIIVISSIINFNYNFQVFSSCNECGGKDSRLMCCDCQWGSESRESFLSASSLLRKKYLELETDS